MLYLGAGWENYLEHLGGYDFYLQHSEGDYDVEGSRFYDAFTLDELKRYPAVVGFGGMWHNRGVAERLLMAYVEQGGTLVLDASGNLAEPYRLDGSVLFDTVIPRELVPSNATVRVDPAFAAGDARARDHPPSPWISETGEPWYGAGYSALPGSAPLKVLATLGGKPLVAERRWGKGRVIWVAYNLPFHAKLSGNAGEAPSSRRSSAKLPAKQPRSLRSASHRAVANAAATAAALYSTCSATAGHSERLVQVSHPSATPKHHASARTATGSRGRRRTVPPSRRCRPTSPTGRPAPAAGCPRNAISSASGAAIATRTTADASPTGPLPNTPRQVAGEPLGLHDAGRLHGEPVADRDDLTAEEQPEHQTGRAQRRRPRSRPSSPRRA